MPVLTAIDVLGVQRFIFSSNRLRDVVTGSHLVHWSTSLDGALGKLAERGDIIFAGGGNAVIQFDTLGKAHDFTARYTRLLYDEAPGLEVAVVHKEFQSGKLARALREVQIEMARRKTERTPSVPLLGLSVTASCQETALPTMGFDAAEPTVALCKGILKRRERKEAANAHWRLYLERTGKPEFSPEEFDFPLELDDLGRTIGDTSLIGIVHIDGNGVGQRIKTWLEGQEEEQEKKADGDVAVCNGYQEWSKAIDDLGQKAFQAVVNRVCQRVEQGDRDGKRILCITGSPFGLGFEMKRVDGKWMLPLRPILLGGDDITFVCDGRIALDLAETALAVFDASNVPHLGKITACAGVAIVRVHAPFARAYELAERVCACAKTMLKEKGLSGCALDWHIGSVRPGEALSEIRARQYHADGHRLTCRPYLLGDGVKEPETWRWLSRELLDNPDVGLRGKRWSKRRNKVKALAEVIREGPKGVQSALKTWRVVDPRLSLPQAIENGFFEASGTPLLDALELLDLHLVLEAGSTDQGKDVVS
ncbi:MAG: hypothetical protein GX443_14755 [Deltaproteobacteria bacterium]|nr:hypothetical protein [Deltaproteobacteria bacterium]